MPELNTVAKLYKHVKTGAELFSLENDDENKVFGITFRTPPSDSTGVPHIMEHSVLCGSRKYPVKEPFVELMKGSLQTFLNAFTYADKTCYPIASTNLQDFYNLTDVYLDAVFYPRITPEIMRQEAWHYELDALDAPLSYKGVVFNEMKGAYSSPDSLIARYSERSLFPDNAYQYDSGGDPAVIPDLTYAQFKEFHDTYYHPANARIFFYGDDNPEERLRLLEQYLGDFGPLEVESSLPLQAHINQHRHIHQSYPASDDVDQQKAMLTMNWLLPENTDPTLALALNVLSHILVGIPASPLRKALIDSGLGEDVIGGGLDDSVRQMYFSTGLKGVLPENTDSVEQLIIDTLMELTRTGIDPDTTAASMNTFEFNLREQNYGRYPRGLVVMLQALVTWLHDGDPFAGIAFEKPLGDIKAALAVNPRYFEELVQRYLIDNMHRTTVVLDPDPAMQQQLDAEEQARLVQAKAGMDASNLKEIMAQAQQLKKLQETPDSPEALATVPNLSLDDLDKSPKHVSTLESQLHGTRILYHDLFTNGLLYLDVGFNLHALPQDLLPYAQLFGMALLEIGTETEDFVKLTQRIGRQTGGISSSTYVSAIKNQSHAAAWSLLRCKSTMDQAGDLLAILHDILLTVKLDNPERFMQMLLEMKAQEEAGLIPGGHRVVLSRLRARFNEAYWATEQMGGVSYLFFLRKLINEVQQNWPAVLEKLEVVRHLLVNRQNMLCNVTLDSANWELIKPELDSFLSTLPTGTTAQAQWAPPYATLPEGMTIPAQVNYVGNGTDLYKLGYISHGSTEFIAHYLRSTWLWEQVRVQGGAYGGFCVFDHHSGVFAFISYRDPNLLKTLKTYDQTSTYLRNIDLSDDELVKGIIGTIGAIDAYQLPDAKGYSAMARVLIGYTDETRQQYRTELLNTTVNDFKAFADILDGMNASGQVVVLGAQEALDAANREDDLTFSITNVL
ncbi:MAG: peptidase M16 [Anaerolineales bacterium]|nr:MAG: peptidase M16 [Anaerolineales bacterium]